MTMRSHSPFVGGSGEGSRHPDGSGVVEPVGGALGRRAPPLRRHHPIDPGCEGCYAVDGLWAVADDI